METASLVVLILASVGVTGVFFYTLGLNRPTIDPSKKPPKTPKESYLEVLAARISSVEVAVESLPSLWKEERERAKKQADRSEQAVRDLERKLGVESEDGEDPEDIDWPSEGVLPINAGPGEGEGVPEMSGRVEPRAGGFTAQMMESYHAAIASRRR